MTDPRPSGAIREHKLLESLLPSAEADGMFKNFEVARGKICHGRSQFPRRGPTPPGPISRTIYQIDSKSRYASGRPHGRRMPLGSIMRRYEGRVVDALAQRVDEGRG